MAIFQKIVLQVSTCHVIAQKKLSSLVSGGRTQYEVHTTCQILLNGQLWPFSENLHFRVSIYDAIAQKKHNYLVKWGRTQDEVAASDCNWQFLSTIVLFSVIHLFIAWELW